MLCVVQILGHATLQRDGWDRGCNNWGHDPAASMCWESALFPPWSSGKSHCQRQSSVHGQDPILLPGACCVSDALCDCIFQLLSRPLKRSPSSGWGSGCRDWETSPGCCYLRGLHWVCQAILRSLGYEEIWLSAALRQLASEWTTYLSCESIKKKKRLKRNHNLQIIFPKPSVHISE